MSTKALLLELLISGFFAIACFKARAVEEGEEARIRPRDLFRLTDRLDRLSRTRWQWFAMVGIIILVRLQAGVPLVVEFTAAAQFIVFLALPEAPQKKRKAPEAPVRSARARRKGAGHQRSRAAAAMGSGRS